MSYVSGFMMGAAIGKSIHQMFFSGPSRAAMPRLQNPVPGLTQGVRTAGVRAQQYGARAAAALHLTAGFRCVSKLPGRRRYRAAMSQELAALLQEKLSQLAFLKRVEANDLTGSLLFVYDPADEAKMDVLEDFLRDSIFKRDWQRTVDDVAQPLEAHAGALTKSVRGTVRAFSSWIRTAAHGWLDVSSAAFLVFLLRGLRKMILTKQYPSGSQMLWWAVSLMRGWRTV